MQLLHLKPTGGGAPAAQMAQSKKIPQKTSKAVDLLLASKSSAINNTSTPTSLALSNVGTLSVLQIQKIMEKQSKGLIPKKETHFDPAILRQAYETCRQICARSTSYYLGSLLMTEQRKKAVWAIYAWGAITDELVDTADVDPASAEMLDRWEKRLEDIFNGCPHDIVDTALADTVQRFSLDIEPFKDVMKGMRMDTWKTRYHNFQELQLFCYYMAVTGSLILLPIAGISPQSEASAEHIYEAAFYIGIANQMTNILRDVAEDASLGRIYLPQDELREFGLTDDDIMTKTVTENWREFTKKQVERVRVYYEQGEHIASHLEVNSRWPVWASMMLYKKILDKIEENNYDNLTKRATVGIVEKLIILPLAYAKAMGWCPEKRSVSH